MLNNFDWDYLIMKEHHQELLNLAKQARLSRLALASRGIRIPFYCRMLHWLGAKLVTIGRRMQESYNQSLSTPTIKTPRQCC